MLEHVFITDEFNTLIPNHDTSLALMREAALLNHSVYQTTANNIYIENNNIYADCAEIHLNLDTNTLETDEDARLVINLSKVNNHLRIWIRKDPPVNTQYIQTCQLLQASPNIVLNNPYNIVSHNEKLMALKFPELIPETYITENIAQIKSIINSLDKVVAKPIDGFGGQGIFILEKNMNNLSSILEAITKNNTEKIILQEYLPEATTGDKRIYLLNGEILGAVLRVPSSGNHQANLAYGGKAVATNILPRDKYICDTLKEFIKTNKFYLTGIDIIGEKLTEINVTCPTCIEEISHFSGENKAREIINWSESYFSVL